MALELMTQKREGVGMQYLKWSSSGKRRASVKAPRQKYTGLRERLEKWLSHREPRELTAEHD